MTADNLARDAKRRVQRLPCLVGNVVQDAVKWQGKTALGLHFPGGSEATLPPWESGDAGRAVGRG